MIWLQRLSELESNIITTIAWPAYVGGKVASDDKQYEMGSYNFKNRHNDYMLSLSLSLCGYCKINSFRSFYSCFIIMLTFRRSHWFATSSHHPPGQRHDWRILQLHHSGRSDVFHQESTANVSLSCRQTVGDFQLVAGLCHCEDRKTFHITTKTISCLS